MFERNGRLLIDLIFDINNPQKVSHSEYADSCQKKMRKIRSTFNKSYKLSSTENNDYYDKQNIQLNSYHR